MFQFLLTRTLRITFLRAFWSVFFLFEYDFYFLCAQNNNNNTIIEKYNYVCIIKINERKMNKNV